jgi:hypothetical protein
MHTPDTASVRRAGLAGAVGGALTLASGVVVQGIVQPATHVSAQMWSYPWSSSELVPVSLIYAVFHVLVIVGILGYRRSGVAGTGRAVRIGAGVALAGTAVLCAAELLSIAVADQRTDDTGARLVGATFGLGTVLSAVGFLVLGVATVRAARWQGWRRYVALALGAWLLVTTYLAGTPALAGAVAIYGLLLTALGGALYTRPTPGIARPRGETIQV